MVWYVARSTDNGVQTKSNSPPNVIEEQTQRPVRESRDPQRRQSPLPPDNARNLSPYSVLPAIPPDKNKVIIIGLVNRWHYHLRFNWWIFILSKITSQVSGVSCSIEMFWNPVLDGQATICQNSILWFTFLQNKTIWSWKDDKYMLHFKEYDNFIMINTFSF